MSTLPLKPVSVETVIPARERSWNEFSLKTGSFHAYLIPTTIPKKCTGAVILSTSNLELNQKNFNLWLSPPPISNACRVEDDFDNSILHLKALIIVSTM